MEHKNKKDISHRPGTWIYDALGLRQVPKPTPPIEKKPSEKPKEKVKK